MSPLCSLRWHELIYDLAKVLLPVLGLSMLLAGIIHLMQVGPMFLPDKLIPDFSRVDPLSGFQRLFSMGSGVRLIFGLFKIGVIGTVALYAIYKRREEILGLTALDVAQIAWFTWDFCFWTCAKSAWPCSFWRSWITAFNGGSTSRT